MAVFAGALDALNCAVAMQQAVRQENQKQDEERRLRLRVGLHVGEPVLEEGDYFGTPVVVARRLCDCAQGGQIRSSDLVRKLVGSRGGFAFRELGKLELKGIQEPVAACEVLWESEVEQAEAGRRVRDAPSGPPPLPPLLAGGERTAFVGRERELRWLRRQWERARGGQRQLVLLAGEPGVGKTRLAAEFALAAHAEGATVLFGRSEEKELVAYQPFVEALRHYIEASDIERLPGGLRSAATALDEVLRGLPATGRSADDYRLVAAVTAFVAEACRESPLVLIVDDLQWADRSTLSLVRHLARSAGQAPLLLLGTYREIELDRSHPLTALIADLRRERLFDRVSLEGLDERDTAKLVRAWAGQEPSPDFARAIHEQTEGNPFFVEEVLRDLVETGAIYEQDGRLTARKDVAGVAIAQSVKEVIGQRLSRLSGECNSLLTIASVIGRQFGLDRLEQASDLAMDRLLAAMDEAVAARVIDEVPYMAGRYSFSHALIYDALYDELTTTRRVRLHGQTLQYADSKGVKLAYEVLGASGPYVIAVGITNCPAVRIGNRAEGRKWDRICRHCRLILYDRRGVGFSAAPERGYSMHASVEDLRAVLDAVGVERVILWGAVDGGPLALGFAAQYPDRVLGLILLGTTARCVSSEDFALGVDPDATESFLRIGAADRVRAVSQMVSVRPSPPQDARDIAQVLGRVPPHVWMKVVNGVGAPDARPLLHRVRAPALIVHDPDNDFIPVEAAHFLHEHLPDSRLEITDEYGPPPYGEALYRRIEAFLDEVSRRRGT